MALRLRTCLSLLLSAVVLAGGIVPPGLRHTHLGGDQPHHHHGDDGGQHEGAHPGHHHHPHRAELGPAIPPALRIHIHLAWFGLDLTLPDPDDLESRGNRPFDEGPTLVRLVDDQLPNPERTPSTDESAFTARHLLTVDVPAHVPIVALSPLITSPPLCDIARHERSGVQLT